MWIKLSGEFVNLDHIVRVRANKSFKNGRDEWVVELEGIIKGKLQYFTRYRGTDAEVVVHALETHSRLEPVPATCTADASAGAPHQATTNTLHDVKIM
jgi:hypothetical protein